MEQDGLVFSISMLQIAKRVVFEAHKHRFQLFSSEYNWMLKFNYKSSNGLGAVGAI